jgi:hypothetical protein
MTISIVWKSLKNQDKQLSEIDKLQRQGKRKSSLSSGPTKRKDFVERQKSRMR